MNAAQPQRYFLKLAYNGSAYHGWQMQQNAHTVQACLDKAISTILREDIESVGQGRTDTGVHAICSYAHFETATPLPNRFLYQLNAILPSDIAVNDCFKVNSDAHARFTAIYRRYRYLIHFNKDPFNIQRSARFHPKPDIEAMNQACADLLGTHDFSCFSKSNTQVKTNICTIHYARWHESADKQSAYFEIQADRFLRNMVRAIVGTLLEIGWNHLPKHGVQLVMDSKNRSAAGQSVPACGLYLIDVGYPDTIFVA